jgi:uncharacterized protein YeaO (DUF488 family)
MRKIETDGKDMKKSVIRLKRAYDPVDSADGARFLVERLWPRGVKKTALPMEAWLKDVAPSSSLRRWFGHDPKKWSEFRRRYFHELSANVDALEPIIKASRSGPVTLVYSSHDMEHNNAVALKDFVESRILNKKRL